MFLLIGKSVSAKVTRVRVMLIVGFLVFILTFILPISGFSFDPAADTDFVLRQGSSYCLGCHDGTLGPNIKKEFSHPVEINYVSFQLHSGGRLRNQSQLDPAIHLLNGQVVCTSCHRPDSPMPAKLTVTNSASKLCFSCHNL